jgi:aromatic ring-opening dioxygenase catalytic subunit (LigB family)
MPVYAIAHGGGPWPWIKDLMPVDTEPLEQALVAISAEITPQPRAVLMVTAHWEAPAFTVQTHPQPPMLYDYYGFPPETYQIQYPAPGHPEVAERVFQLLDDAGLPADRDAERGFDHGTFVPMFVLYPEARIPVVQLSLQQGFDPALHVAAGRALAPLRDEGVLIIGSGLPSYHNLAELFGPTTSEVSGAFDAWLTETMVEHNGEDRYQRLLAWRDAPGARRAHPRDDHFLPVLVATGAADSEAAVRNYHESAHKQGDMVSSGYRLGSLPVASGS